MLTDLLLNALIDLAITVLVIGALVLTCASMIPPRLPRGPRPPGR
ncbi:hypothetical protein ACQPW3_20285 [Actinosynnema sp. CA-248983]